MTSTNPKTGEVKTAISVASNPIMSLPDSFLPVPVYREVREIAGGDEVNDEDFPLTKSKEHFALICKNCAQG